MRLTPRVATLLVVAALPLALTACSSGSSSDNGGTGAKPAKAKDLNAGLATGTQLKKALAPASVFPSGFAPEADGASDSGGQFLSPADRSTAKPDCTRLESTSWIQVTGFKGGVSFAQNDYVNHDKTEEVAQEVDAFQGTTANAVMKQLQTVAGECAGFTDTDAHAKVKLAGTSTAGLGDEAYTMTLTSGVWQNGSTLIAARSGNSVITVLSTAGTDNGAATAKKVTTRILDGLKSLKTA
ncbi:hypothetical protein [Streptomyces barringtoniae]|uniref:hypothetical protein n=1 Tax=Streptomyces barringtoniae TaxID=2892029 RepID=UPI001E3A6009|nr:hypothetical protein [Streptomyces barringtoniae]MCC5480022.1 hypothetical protein [Streptomyces barringtoniae]